MENSTPTPAPTDTTGTAEATDRPLGFWIRTVDGLLARERASALESEGLSRREAHLLRLLGGSDGPERDDRLDRRFGGKLRRLSDRGWATRIDGAWSLTDEGRAARARLVAALDGIRSRVAAAVSEEDVATTQTTLEAIARELGHDPADRRPLGAGSRRGGPAFGRRRFGGSPFDTARCGGHGADVHHGRPADTADVLRADPEHSRPHGPDVRSHDPRGAGHGHSDGDGGGRAERAYARGFEAGFIRGREAAS